MRSFLGLKWFAWCLIFISLIIFPILVLAIGSGDELMFAYIVSLILTNIAAIILLILEINDKY